MAILADELKTEMTMLIEILGYLYMALVALAMLSGFLFLIIAPIAAIMSVIDAIKGKPDTPLSDSFINFWSATHSDRSDD